MTKIAAYGAWASPVRAADLVAGARRFSDIQRDGDQLYWLEARPEEQGRQVVVTLRASGAVADVIPRDFNMRTRVHEYGGGAYLAAGGTLWFSNFSDQRLYRMRLGSAPQPISAPGLRFADGTPDPTRARIIGVCEDHRSGGEPRNTLVAMGDGLPPEGVTLFSGTDFVSSPRLSPDGRRIAFITWNHPNMPWDDTQLHVAGFDADGRLEDQRIVNAGFGEAAMDPFWTRAGELLFVSDRGSGWWNLHRLADGSIEPITREAFEFGGPRWNFGHADIAELDDGALLAVINAGGTGALVRIDRASGRVNKLDLPIVGARSLVVKNKAAYFVAAFADRPSAVVALDLETLALAELRASTGYRLDDGFISRAVPVSFPSGGASAHGFYYTPRNAAFEAPEGARPPLIVHVHGGPTGQATPAFSLERHFWTTRGFAILDLNYRGSTGFGRAYRQSLYGNWGLFDVADAVNGARAIAERGLCDASKLLIAGGSAGGFTVLAAHAFHDVFASGASYYGVSDLEALAKETHKFESRYLDRLVAPYPDGKAVYVARSPIHHLDALKRPLLILQGLEDKVVPPNQAEMIVAALNRKGIPVAYLAFAGEQHGFRKAENIIRAEEAELYFYGRVLGFRPDDPIEPVAILNEERLEHVALAHGGPKS